MAPFDVLCRRKGVEKLFLSDVPVFALREWQQVFAGATTETLVNNDPDLVIRVVELVFVEEGTSTDTLKGTLEAENGKQDDTEVNASGHNLEVESDARGVEISRVSDINVVVMELGRFWRTLTLILSHYCWIWGYGRRVIR